MKNEKDLLSLIQTCNPVYGCSIGCPYCYARRLNTRFKITPDFSIPTIMPKALDKIHTRMPHAFLMTSMSDFSGWPIEWRTKVFEEMKKYPKNTYLFLTKRPELISIDCRDQRNVYLGVTITGKTDVARIQKMKQTMKAANYFVTIEPLHNDVGKIDLTGISYLFVGAETGNRAGKPIPKKEWVDNIVSQADKAGCGVWMKDSLLSIVGEKDFRQDKFPWQ